MLIPAMEKALIDFSAARVTQPVRVGDQGRSAWRIPRLMPALTPDDLD